MAYRLLLPLDFLASSHVPQMCIFTGRQAPAVKISQRPVSLVMKHAGDQRSVKVILPTSPGAARARKFVDAIPLLALLVVGMLISGVTCAVLSSSSELRRWVTDSSRVVLKWALIGVFLAIASAAIWAINRWMQSRFVTMTLVRNGTAVMVSFPARYRATHDLYQASLKTYQAAGSPPPGPWPAQQPKETDDWADTVQPGWDDTDK